MWLKTAVMCCLIATSLCAEENRTKRKEPRGKRNLEYNLSHHPHHPNYRLERRIAVGPQLNRYPAFFPTRGNAYRKGRPQSAPAPPYAVAMEPLMQFSQRDPLYDPNLLHVPTLNQNDLTKSEDLQTDNNHVSENVYGTPKHVIERPVYIKEPEPIIEIIIKESNVTLPPVPLQVITPAPKKKEQVQVFYVKYKKNPHGKGKDSIIYEKPVPAISPPINDEDEVVQQPEIPQHEYVTSAPLLSTTLRAIIKPDSETYHAHKGIHITFGKNEKHSNDDQDEESAPQPSLSLPQGSERRPLEGHFRSERQRVPQGHTPFGPPPPPLPPYFPSQEFGRKIPSQNFPPSQSFPHSHSFPPSQSFPPPHSSPSQSINPPPPSSHQIPRTPPFHQPPPNHNRPNFQNYNYFKQQSQVLIPPTNFRQPVPYQPFDQIRQQGQSPNERFPFPKPHSHFPVRSPQLPINQPPAPFSQNTQNPPTPFTGNQASLSQFENGFGQQLPLVQNQVAFNQFKQQEQDFNSGNVQFPPQVQQQQQFQQNSEALKNEAAKQERFQFGPQFGQQFGPEQNRYGQFNEQVLKQDQIKQFGQEQYKLQQDHIQQYHQQQIQQQQNKIKEQLQQQNQYQQPNQYQQQNQFRQQESFHNQGQHLIPPGGELIQSVPKYEQHFAVNSNGQHEKIQFTQNENSQNAPQSQALRQEIQIQPNQAARQNFLDPNEFKLQVQQQFNQGVLQENKGKSVDVEAKQNEQFLRQFQQQHHQLTQLSQNQQLNKQSFAELQFQQLIANQPGGPAYVSSTPTPSTTQRIQYSSSTQTSSTTTEARPETTTKSAKELNLQLPDEVPDDLRQQLLSSGILNHADISVLDYDKVGDIPISALPPDQLANFYSAGGAAQLASGSAPIPSVVKPDDDQIPAASSSAEIRVKPDNVEMKVIRYDPESDEGKNLEKSYIKENSKQTDPVELNGQTYNRYLPLKVSGAQFPIPDIPDLKGKTINSVVVLAPVDYDFKEKSRVTRDANLEGIKFPNGSPLKNLLDNPSRENYIKFLESENKTSADQQSVILLVTGSSEDSMDREIFMYDISTQSVSKLSGELSSAFVDAADANTNDPTGSASNVVEVRVPSPAGIDIDRSDNISTDLEGEPSEIIESKIPVIDPMETDLDADASENFEHFVDVSGQDLSVSDENNVKIESGYSKAEYNMPLH